MTDYDFPDLPSDDELGITDEDREQYEKDFADEGSELTAEERAALLGESASSPKAAGPAGGAGTSGASGKAPDKKAARREEKRKAKEAKRAARADKKAAAAAKKAAAATQAPKGAAAEEQDPAEGESGAPETHPAGQESEPAEKPRPPVPSGPRSKIRGPATLALLLVVAAISSTRTGLPRPVPANVSDTVFSSSRAMTMLIDIAAEAHPTGSPEHTRVREYLTGRLRALGLEPEIQTTTTVLQGGSIVRAATVRNVLARIPGSDPTGAILITAHYDSRQIARGAGDDGTGVVAILESLRAIRASGEPLRNDVIVLLTDAEELNLLGARAFVDEHPWMEDVSLVLSFEMRGAGGPALMFETGAQNGWIVHEFAKSDPHAVANSLMYDVYRRFPLDTDFTPFKEASRQGLNFAAVGRGRVYHQEYDAPENLSESTLQHQGLHALSALRHFGNAELGTVTAPDVVYFNVPLMGLVAYDVIWVLPGLGVVLALGVMATLLAMRAGARAPAIVAGFGVTSLGIALSCGSALALVRWLPRFHPELGSLVGSAFHAEGWYVLSLSMATLTIVTGLHAVARRWLSTTELALGALLPPLLLVTYLAFAAPFGAVNLQWPIGASLVAVALVALLGSRADGVVGSSVAVLFALPAVAILYPLFELFTAFLTFRLAAVLAAFMSLLLYLCLPALEGLRHPNGWWAPLAGAVVAGLALGLGVLTGRTSEDRPAPSTLVYAYEHGTGAAVWATNSSDGGAHAEARAWAVQRAGSAFSQTRDLAAFGYRAGEVPVTSAPVVEAPPPEVIITSDTIDGSTRRVELNVRSRIGAEMLGFALEPESGTRLRSLNGVELTEPERHIGADHWGIPDGFVAVALEMPADEPIGLHIVEHLLRPEELLGDQPFSRPANLAPDVLRMSDRAMFRYSIAAFVDPRHAIMLPPGPGLGTATPDSVGAPAQADSTGALAPDTTLERPDTTLASPDTTLASPDTALARRDTLIAPLDTLATRGDPLRP